MLSPGAYAYDIPARRNPDSLTAADSIPAARLRMPSPDPYRISVNLPEPLSAPHGQNIFSLSARAALFRTEPFYDNFHGNFPGIFGKSDTGYVLDTRFSKVYTVTVLRKDESEQKG